MPELVIATKNRGKFEEIKAFLQTRHPDVKCIFLGDLKGIPEIVEDGSTFLDNARKKATIVSSFSKKAALADDSGLEVKVLGGRPGVLSARFAGLGASDADNTNKLLEKLKGTPENERKASFRCAIVLAAPNGHTSTAVGELSGVIIDAPRGSSGFGYDPVFLLPETGRTLAEMTLAEKNRISHRGKAMEKILNQLEPFFSKTVNRP